MVYDPLREARDKVARAEAYLDAAKARHLMAKRAYEKIPRWKLWIRWGVHSELSDLSFRITHEAMSVVRAKAHAWDSRERLGI
jgi:hypothetical protein